MISFFAIKKLSYSQLINSREEPVECLNCNGLDPCINLVCNNNFGGNYAQIGDLTVGGSNLVYACPWRNIYDGLLGFDHFETPDFFNSNFNSFVNGVGVPYYGIPLNQRGYEIDHTAGGNTGYAGFYTYAPYVTLGSPYTGQYREYVMYKYPTHIHMDAGKTYSIEFWLSLGEESTFATPVQVSLSTSLPNYSSGYPSNVTMPVAYTTNPVCTTSLGWRQYTFNYPCSVTGDYYLVFGNFNDNSNTPLIMPSIPIIPNVAKKDAAYYYIDDVRITELNPQDVCCNINQSIISDYQTEQLISNYSVVNNTRVYVEGYLAIDESITFIGNDFVFAPNSEVWVYPGVELTFENCKLYSCTEMWQGIIANFGTGTKIKMTGCRIEDAKLSLDLAYGNELILENNLFNNNWECVRVSNYNSNWPLTFNKNRFTNTNTLTSPVMKPPHAGQHTQTGLILENAGYVNLSAITGTANRNIFYNINNGISIYKTNFTLSNALLYQIEDYNNSGYSWCLRAANPDKSQLFRAEVNNTTGLVRFNNSLNGLQTSGTWRVRVSDTRFYDNENTSISVEYNTPYPGEPYPQMYIQNNNIQRTKNGIALYQNFSTPGWIQNNILSNPTFNSGSTGISVINPTSGGAYKCVVPYVNIQHNTISRFQKGINNQFSPCLQVYDNDVFLKGPWWDSYQGIYTENSSNAIVWGNYVEGDFLGWQSIGIRQENSAANIVACNDVYRTGYAMWFGLDNAGTRIYTNRMRRTDNGIFLNWTNIGKQVGIGSNTYAGKNGWDKTTVNTEIRSNNSNGLGNEFYFSVNDNDYWTRKSDVTVVGNLPPFVPLKDDANSSNIYNFYSCFPATFTSPGRSWENLLMADPLVPVYNDKYHSMRRQKTYRGLKEEMNLLDSSAVLYNFYDSLQHTPQGKFEEVETKVGEYDFGQALLINQSVITSDSVELVQRKVHDLLIPYWKMADDSLGRFTVNMQDEQDILDIANLCPLIYGEPVFEARIFIRKFVNPAMVFASECEPEMEPRNATVSNLNDDETSTQYEVLVYPNPASNMVNISLPDDLTLPVRLDVYSIDGRKMNSVQITEQNYQMDIGMLISGVYMYSIFQDDLFIISGKLTVVN